MKRTNISLLLALFVSPLLLQCASQDDVQQLNYQLRVVNKKLENMKKDTMGQMQKRQAASSSQIDQLQREILMLKEQLDETAHLNRTLKEQNKELESSIRLYSEKSSLEREEMLKQVQEREKIKNEQISALSRKLEVQQQTVKALQASRVKEAERKAREAALAAEAAKRKARSIETGGRTGIPQIYATQKKIIKSSPSVASTRSTPVTEKPTPKPSAPNKTSTPTSQSSVGSDLFSKAQSQYKNGNYKTAYLTFEQYVEKNRSGDKNIEARYMMGECLFWQKEYDQAILQYQKIISNHPRHAKAASALLRQGMAFEKLSDNETAKIIYKKIANSYSSSPEAKTAQQRAANL